MRSLRYNGHTVHLVEAPSLDSPGREEGDIFEEWAYWLTQSYKMGIRINGMVYVHNILDPRLTHSALYGLEVFKEMCGVENYPAMVMATTRWDKVGPNEGAARAAELVDNHFFWRDLRDGGSCIARLLNDTASAMEIVTHILDQEKTYVLALQRELIDEGKELHKTDAGKVLYETWAEEKDKLERLKQDLKQELDSMENTSMEGMKEELTQISQEIERYVKEADQKKQAMKKLQKNTEGLTEIWDAKVKVELNSIRDQLSHSQEYLAELEKIYHDALEGKTHYVDVRADFEKELKLMRERVTALRAEPAPKDTYGAVVNTLTCISQALAVIIPLAACTVM
jgi:hypothetical protein